MKKHIWILVLILALGAGLRAAYLVDYSRSSDFRVPLLDYLYHDYWAKLVAFGNSPLPSGTANPMLDQKPYFRPPGYSFFLAGIYRIAGSGPYVPRVANMGLGLISVVLAYLLAVRAGFERRVGLIFAFLMSVSWQFIYHEGKIHEPPLSVALGLLLVLVLGSVPERLRKLPAAGAGVVMGLFALVRPNILPCALGVVLWLTWVAWRGGSIRRALLLNVSFLFALALTIAPATIRNRVVAKDTVLISANSGVNLMFGNYPGSDGVLASHPALGAWSCFDYPSVVAGLEHRLGHPVSYSESSAYFSRQAWGFMKKYPGSALRLTLRKLLLFWAPMEVDSVYDVNAERNDSRLLRSLPLNFALLASLAFTGLLLFATERHRKGASAIAESDPRVPMVVLLLLVVVMYTLPHGLFIVSTRYRIPLIPFLLLGASYGISELVQMLKDRRLRSFLAWAAVIAGGCFLASRNPTGYQSDPLSWKMNTALSDLLAGDVDQAIQKLEEVTAGGMRNPQPYARLGFCYEKKRQYRLSEESFKKALVIDPRFLEARIGLGQILMQQHRGGEGIEQFRQAVQTAPGHASAHELLGSALLSEGRTDEAVAELSEAIRLNPHIFEAHMALGSIELNRGRLDDAMEHFVCAGRLKPQDPQIRHLMAMFPEIGKRLGVRPVLGTTAFSDLSGWGAPGL